MSNIQDLKKAVSSGLYRNHKWRVLINFPEFAGTADVVSQASVLARTSKTPDGTMGVIEVPFEGRVLPLPGDRTFEELTVTFLNVNDFRVKNSLEVWQEAVNGSESNTTTSIDANTLMRDLVFELLDINDNVVKTYTLEDGWPSIVGGIDVDRGAVDSSSEFTATFRYTQARSNTTR